VVWRTSGVRLDELTGVARSRQSFGGPPHPVRSEVQMADSCSPCSITSTKEATHAMSDADEGKPTGPSGLIDPALYHRENVRPVLAVLDIGALYRILQDAGVSQRQIAALTGRSQSEVSDIVAGRAVLLTAPVALWGQPLFGEIPNLPGTGRCGCRVAVPARDGPRRSGRRPPCAAPDNSPASGPRFVAWSLARGTQIGLDSPGDVTVLSPAA